MPSTTSSSVSSDLASSTVMTPSLPTFFIASANMRPISASPLAEIVPTWAISSLVDTGLARFLTSATIASTAMSMPRLRSIGFIPAATARTPSRTIACARIVAVVVPSPASVLVFEATSLTICAPMFSNLSLSSISLATVTPSLVMRGAPNDLSITTLRPLGPSVTRTASARMSIPRNMRSRASVLCLMSLAAMIFNLRYSCRARASSASGGDDAHNVGFFHDQQFLAVKFDLGAGPFAEQHAIVRLYVEGLQCAVITAGARANGDNLAFHRLFLGRVGDDDAAPRFFFLVDAANHD